MKELKWLDEYSGQTTAELIAMEKDHKAESLVIACGQALEQRAEDVGYDDLTDEERVVLAVVAIEREVNNGGFIQLFSNSSKELAPLFVDALSRIGCVEAARLTQQAIDVLGLEGDISVDDIDEEMGEENEERDQQLSECDERYYEVAGDLSDSLFAFIKKNARKITLKD